MPKIYDPETSQDLDQPLNQDPMFTSSHIFSTDDITGTYDGLTQGTVADGETPVVDFTADPMITNDGTELYPINSEFGFIVTDFDEAVDKDFVLNPEYEEGWAGNLYESGELVGVQLSDSATDTFKTPAKLGTWLAGIGGNTVKASTEHYSVMQHILSDQMFPEDPDAVYQLDDNLILLSQNPLWDGQYVADLLADPGTFGVTDTDNNGVLDIKDVLNPNESTIRYDIAYSDDYSVTMKDDGKLLYRWGNTVKRPNDIRLDAKLELPDEWQASDYETSVLGKLFQVTSAELVVRHTITNNPNDQIRPEDFENEAAIGQLPTYEIQPDGKWVTTDDYYAGDGTLYPAGTVLKDPALAAAVDGTVLDQLGATSEDLDEGYTNAWYTTMDREPFEPELNEDGTEYITGPRWRLKPDKYGQDLPSIVIPEDPSLPPPPTKDEVKYEVGADTHTVINLLDWETSVSPLDLSAGWQNVPGTVSENGLNMTSDFDVAVYLKGDKKPASIYDAQLLMDYEEVSVADQGDSVTGTAGDDVLAGAGGNTFTGGTGGDMFVLSYGTLNSADIVASTIADFEVGTDAIGLVGLGVDDTNFNTKITQTVVGSDLEIYLDGVLLATLTGVDEPLDMEESFRMTTGIGVPDDLVAGTAGDDLLVGDENPNLLAGLGGNDTIQGLGSGDTLYGGAGDDSVLGGTGNDLLYGGTGNDSLYGEDGFDWFFGGAGNDSMVGGADIDMVSFYDSAAGVVVDLAAGTAMSGADTDSIEAIENVTGSVFGDVITGDAGANWIRALGDYDWIHGSAGADTIDGGSGDDMISYIASTARVVVDLGAGTGLEGLAAGDTYVSVERATGSSFNDVFYGGDKAEVFRGMGGYDLFHGSGGGKDSYDGGTGLDTVSYSSSASGVGANLAGFGWIGDADDDVFTSIENLTGSNFDDFLFGDGGRNQLVGLAGNDQLDGGADVDYLTGGAGNDAIDGGWGWDYAIYSGNQDQYGINTVGGVTTLTHLNGGSDGIDTLVNVEVLRFADGDLLLV